MKEILVILLMIVGVILGFIVMIEILNEINKHTGNWD